MRKKLISLIYKYISLQALAESNKTGRKPKVTTEMSIDALASFLIENGVVIPVRCGECRHALIEQVTDGVMAYRCRITDDFESYDHYCSYGEPKEKVEK